MEGNKETYVKRRFINRLIAYWPVFLLLILLSVGCSWYYLQSFSPLYRAAIKIAVSDDQHADLDTQKITSRVISSLRSEKLSNRVVYQLQLYTSVFTKGITNLPVYRNSPFIVLADSTVTIQAGNNVTINISDSTATVDHKIQRLNKWGYTAYGKFKFLKNEYFKENGRNDFFISFIPVQQAADDILSRLHVSASGRSPGIIDLYIEDAVPQRAEDILSSLVKFYNASHSSVKNTSGYQLKLIDQRIAKVENDLLKIESEGHQTQNQNAATRAAITQRQKTATTLYTSLLNKKEAAALALTLPAAPNIKIINTAMLPVLNTPVHSTVYLIGIFAAILIGFIIITVKEAITWKWGSELIAETIHSKPRNAINRQRTTINERLNKLKHAIKGLWNGLSREDTKHPIIEPTVKIDAVISHKPQVNILERLTKLKDSAPKFTGLNLFNGNNKPALSGAEDEPLAYKPNNRPEIPKIEKVSISERSTSFKTARKKLDDIKTATQNAIIQPISKIKLSTRRNQPIDSNQNISIAEQFSRLRQTLGELGISGDRKKVMITSAIPGEGKDFVATNLALSLALTGKKVVLLDFDIHRASLGKRLGAKQKAGILDYLQGKARFEDIILKTQIDENLFFIPAGHITEEEYELKMNDLAEKMLNQLSDRFDHIIVSTAPIRPFGDAYILSPLCDATLYIVRHAFSPKAFIGKFNKFSILNKLKNAAVIFNEA